MVDSHVPKCFPDGTGSVILLGRFVETGFKPDSNRIQTGFSDIFGDSEIRRFSVRNSEDNDESATLATFGGCRGTK